MSIYPSLQEVESLARQGYTLIPIGIEMPADTLTPVSAFLRMRASGSTQAFLLESADGGEEVGRYSFLGIDPFADLKSLADELIYQNHETQSEERDVTSYDKIGEKLTQFRSPSLPQFPPFVGGAVGYVSYDAVRYLENIPLPKDQLGAADMRFMYFKHMIAFDRLKHRLYIVTHIAVSDSADIAALYEHACQTVQQIRNRLMQGIGQEEFLDFSMSDVLTADPVAAEAELGEERYCEAVKKIKQYIRQGDIFQCVLSDRFSFPMTVDPFLVYRVLRMINPSPYLYYLSTGDEVLLGSSPEMLVRCVDRTLQTCPIAGTRPRGQDVKADRKLESDLLASVKEKAEHLMLVDLGRNDLGRVSRPGTVTVKDFMKVERYSHVMHLVSLVEGQLKSKYTPWEALGACFPAGTLSGAPKIRAMEIISELEQSRRGPYGGAIVCQDFSGNLNSCITIRSLYVKDGRGYAQAGAGVVADSSPHREYQEVLNKAKAIRSAVAMAQVVAGGQG
ncbi:MAG: anthranilate synthase component I [Oligoflexus sp.]